jgi:hypothetical protein
MRRVWPVLFLFVVLVLVVVSAACHRLPPSSIKSFTAEREKITRGQIAKLTAVFDGSGFIDHDIGDVKSGSPIETKPLDENTTFTLTVNDDKGMTFTQSLEIKVIAPATIKSFKQVKVVRPGEPSELVAEFEGGVGVVDQGVGPIQSGVPKSIGRLDATKTYTLTVTNAAGDPVTAQAEAEAAVTPVISRFDAPGPVVGRYAPTTLTAVFTGGKGVIDLDVGPVQSNVPVATKDVPAGGATWTLTVTNGLGESVKKSVSVTTKKEMFVTNYDGDVMVFDVDASGDVPPKRKILTRTGKNQGSGITGLLGILVTNDSVILANENGTPSISIFGIADRDDAAPKRRLSGGAGWVEGVTGAYLISMAGGELFVADKSSSIEVWNLTDTGAVAPKRKIQGAATQLNNAFGTWVDNGELYVTNNGFGAQGAQTVTVYPQGASGNVAPIRTFPLSVDIPSGVLVSGDELFVCSADAVTVLNKNTGAQLRQIKGAATKLAAQACECSIADGEIFCASDINNVVVVFPTNANGNVAPKRIVGGPTSTLDACGTVDVF